MQSAAVKGFRLSIQQARLWSVQGASLVYRALCRVRIEGELDSEIFQRALHKLSERHAILRTRFYCIPGMDVPVQVVSSQGGIACPLVSLENIERSEWENQVTGYMKIAQETAFDLAEGPLLYCVLLRLSASRHILLISLPTFCADAATLKHLIAELARVYDACLQGKPLPDDPLQYADVSAWQDELLEEDAAEEQRNFWQRADLSLLDTMCLPFEGSTHQKSLVEEVSLFAPQMVEVPGEMLFSPQLRMLFQRTGASLEAFLLACWQVIIWRLTAQTSVLMGVECDGRYYEELVGVPGLYSRVVPISISLSEELPFERVLSLVHSFLDEAKKRQMYFSWQSTSSAGEYEQKTHYFPISFAYEDWPAGVYANDLVFVLEQSLSCLDPFALKLHALRVGQKLHLQLYFDPRRLSACHMQRLAKSLSTLLQGVLMRPETAVGALPIISFQDQQHLRRSFTASAIPVPFQTLAQAFEAQVECHPEQVAVECEGEQLTYHQLNAHANRLAHALQRVGVGPNVLVGLYVERSVHMLLGMLAILKAGGAYVPLDPDQPTARLTYQLRDLQTPIILAQKHLQTFLPLNDGQVLFLDDPGSWGSQELEYNPSRKSAGEDLAYVMYTSGSTGVPKGVMIRQESVVNYTFAFCEMLGLQPGLQFATVSTLAADLGNTSIFCSLASGGCLHILSYTTVTSGTAFADYVAQHPIDVLKIVPSHLSALLDSCEGRVILPSKYLVLGGEALSYALLRRLEQQGGICCVLNHYGPTETTIGVLVNVLGSLGTGTQVYDQDRNEAATVPIGRPIAGMEAYVLDQFLQIVPVGVTGELYLGGVGLAAGYLQQPEQTRERFVEHPWGKEAGARLYRTGDLAQYQNDRSIEFVGRADSQVKLRGYRIELGELVAVLERHPKVRESVVVLREDIPGDKRLVAYVVAQQPLPDEEELRRFMEEQLPVYMIPSSFVFLRMLPLNANGKIDHRMLPAPNSNESQRKTHVAPRTPVEEILVGIWKSVLQVKQIGIHDNFSSLGGHSLLATQIISRIRLVLHVDVPLRCLFEAPTVAGLSERVEQIRHALQRVITPPLLPVSRTEELPLSFAQQRLWFLHQLDPGSAAYNVPVAVRLHGTLKVELLERSLGEVVGRHENLRTTFQAKKGSPVQIIHPVGAFQIPLVDLRGLVSSVRKTNSGWIALQEAQQTFNFVQGPLLRTTLVRISEDEHVMLLTMHHIVSDAWSRNVFISELTALYNAFVAGKPSHLPPLPIQYADFACWQRRWLQGEVLQSQLDYWTWQLSNIPPLELPTDYARPVVQTFNGTYKTVLLPTTLNDALKKLSQRTGTTLFMTLLAAFQVLLAKYTGQHDVAVGTPIANRTRAEIEGLIGFFTNTLVMRTDLSGNPPFQEVLARVREIALEAYAHQDLPFEKLVEVLQPERDLGRSPLFQVMFILQHASQLAEALHNLTLDAFPYESTTSKFDLTLSMIDTGQELRSTVEYNTDLFNEHTIALLLDRWHFLLEAIVSDPQRHIDDLSLLTGAERQQVLVEWNATQAAYSSEACLHTLFEEQVMRTPDAVAVVYTQEQLTYEKLNQQANQLASYLQTLGVRQDVAVGICVERSLKMAIGVLGILKAGGAYVPLDPAYPQERLAFMLMDAHVSILLTQQRPTIPLPELNARPVYLDSDWKTIAQEDTKNLDIAVDVEHLTYIIFTSGSTGMPKGIAMPHRALSHLMQWQKLHSALHVGSRTLQFTSLSFDVACQELFSTWCAGGIITLIENELRYDLDSLVYMLAEAAIQRLFLPFVALQQLALAAEGQTVWPTYLKEVITAGEQLQVTVPLRNFFARLSNSVLYNQYGPAESHVVTAFMLDSLPSQWSPLPPIGSPIANTQIYLLAEQMQPVPIGLPGEIYIGGIGLARGYLHRPELTAERFLPDPFSAQPGKRLYRSGDRARYLPGGTIEFLGRRDYQVKIRGYRIELAEIESILNQYPGVSECVVLVCENVTGDKRVVAYVVSSQKQPSTSNDWHHYLRQKLPDYMVPSAFVKLDSLPLTPSGKVDRHTLSITEVTRPELEVSFVAPRTAAEEVVAGIWTDILGVKQVGVYDNFFDVGGHSLLATQVISRLCSAFQIELPLRSLFEVPTIGGLVCEIARIHGGREIVEEIALVLKEIEQLTEDEVTKQLSK